MTLFGVIEDSREAHDGHRVLGADLAAVDLFEEADRFVVPAKLGIVVFDVARREQSKTWVTSTWSITASKIRSRGEYW